MAARRLSDSHISEFAWRESAEFLDFAARDPLKTKNRSLYEERIAEHILKVVVPNLLRRAEIIANNRRSYR